MSYEFRLNQMASGINSLSNKLPDRHIQNFLASDQYRAEIHDLIVGGAHTYSKGDDQFPLLAPAAIARGKGGRVWDLDGNEYVDCGLGLGAVSLGHAYQPVLDAVREQLELGAAFVRPAAIERDLAREFLALLPGMDRVKFAKNGSNATTAAVRLARAFTGRDYVAFPKTHPFFSFDDWFIGSTLTRAGIPNQAMRLSLRYDFGDPESLEKLFKEYPGQIACVITEPEDAIPSDPSIIRQVEQIAKSHGALFILDEMVTGFRANFPGDYTAFGLSPDLTTWGKGLGNGFSFCAIAGRADVMELGGLRQNESPRVFLLSTTHGGEAHVLAAARAVIREYQSKDVIAKHRSIIAAWQHGFLQSIADFRLEAHLKLLVAPWRIILTFFDEDGQSSAALRMLFIQEMIGHGALNQGIFLPCFEHDEADVTLVLNAFENACAVLAHALEHGVGDLLIGEPARPVFRKFNGCRQVCPATPCPFELHCKGIK